MGLQKSLTDCTFVGTIARSSRRATESKGGRALTKPEQNKVLSRPREEATQEVESLQARQENPRVPCFLQLTGPEAGRLWVPSKEQKRWKLGRGEDTDLQIIHSEISRHHLEIQLFSDRFLKVKDLQSKNGTFVNYRRVQETSLVEGDKIHLGPYLSLRLLWLDSEETEFHKRLYEYSIRDGLTGVFNRRHFFEMADKEWSYAKRHQVPLSLALLDLDHFKKLNDSYGHSTGDRILQEMTQRISQTIRQEDLFARYGGEEFLLLLRDTDQRGLLLLAERVRRLLRSTPFETPKGPLSVTVSMGLVTFSPTHMERHTPHDMIELADLYLYKAKQAGRDRVWSSTTEPEEPRVH